MSNRDQYGRPLSQSACDEDSLRARLAEAEKDATRSRHEWQRECEDTDLLLQGMGLCPSEYRSECGSLLLARIRHKMGHIGLRLDETLARLAEVEAERDKILRLWLDDADPAECGYAADSASVPPSPEARLYDDKPCAECGMRPAFDGMWHKPDCPTLNHPIQKPAPPMTGGGDCSGNAIAADKSGASND